MTISYLTKNYNRKKVSFKKGRGSFLYATNGIKYLDFVQGIAVNSLGHAHPKLVKAINEQAKKLLLIMFYFKIVVLKLQRQLLKLPEDIFIQ